MQIKKLSHSYPETFTLPVDSGSDSDQGESTCLTLWIPVKYKKKYEKIQGLSQREFGKYLKGLVVKAIEGVEIDEAS